MNSNSWLKLATERVPRLEAELLLAHVLGVNRVDLHAHPERELTDFEVSQVKSDLKRRIDGEPIAYIVGYKEFFGRKFAVTEDVLIPRPETEALVEIIVGLNPKRVLDVGTGSGVIAISVALELPEAQITALDVSPEALLVAQDNAKRLGATSISFLHSDLLSGLSEADKRGFDVIVANLPYVDRKWDWNAQELDFEPQGALYADDGGLKIIKKLMLGVKDYMSENGCVVLEADASQHEKIKEYAVGCGLALKQVLGLALVFRQIP